MSEINVNKKSEEENRWIFGVLVDDLDFLVEMEKDYWRKLTGEKIEPEELVKKSFEFLLAREPKESILRSFNLKVEPRRREWCYLVFLWRGGTPYRRPKTPAFHSPHGPMAFWCVG